MGKIPDSNDYIGKKFGKLTILKVLGKNKWRKRLVECQCECGNIIISVYGNLKFRRVHSCTDCRYKFKKSNEKGKVGFNILKTRYIRNAMVRKLPFNLTDDEIKILTKGNCFYCNSEPNLISINNASGYKNKEILKYSEYIYNGIDRVDNTLGYSITNSVSCCENCNRMKLDLTRDEFLTHIKKIYKYIFGDKNG